MNNTLIDNSADFRLVRYIKDLLNNPQCTELKIATGYWDLPGTKLIYDELKSFFERGGRFDLLIGQEPMLRSYMITEEAVSEKFPDFYIQRDVELLHDNYKDVAQLLIDHMDAENEENAPLRVHVYGQGEEKKFLHAKCYIFLGRGFAHGIIGSSNFTQKGLEENAELNYLETENSVVIAPDSIYSNSKSHLTWFKEKWDESEPWTGEFIKILTGTGTAPTEAPDVIVETDDLTPYEVYIRLLQDQFGTIVNDQMDDELKSFLDGTIYNPIDYQLDAVKEVFGKMNYMGGFLLADVVGLGKTICGVLLIKYYLEHVTDRTKKILIITPPAIQQSWKDTIEEFNKGKHPSKLVIGDNVDFITSGSIEKVDIVDIGNAQEDFDTNNDDGDLSVDSTKDYSLILIDESHKFRNSKTKMYTELTNVIDGICNRQGWYPYVGLLTATPQNNQPSDIQNQILLFEHEPKNSHFDRIPNKDFEEFFGKINSKYKQIRHLGSPQAKIDLMNLAKEVREKVLESIMVRRTRTDIQNNYHSGLVFPDIIGPVKLDYVMDPPLATAFYNTMNAIGRGGTLKYSRYRAIEALKSAKQKPYTHGSMTAKKSADALASIIQILLVKRLESSFDAFRKSLTNQKKYIENFLQMIADDCIFICPDIDVNAELDIQAKQAKQPTAHITFASCYDDLRQHIQRLNNSGRNQRNQNAEYHASDFTSINNYKNDLESDLRIIDSLIADWNNVHSDPKLEEFLLRLNSDIMTNDSVRFQSHLVKLNNELAHANAINDTFLTEAIKAEIERLDGVATKIKKNDELERKLVIFSEAIDTVKRLETECKKLGYQVLAITAANRDEKKDEIRLNFDANVPVADQKNDYNIIITTEVLAEGINLHRANAIVNYDSPWNATKLIQRIGRVNRIGSKAAAVFVYNFHPSAEGDDVIALVQNAYTKLQSFHIMFGEDNAVFSDDEQVVSYSSAINGAPSPLQPFIQELRNYKDTHPERYQMIAAAPMNKLTTCTDAVGLVAQQKQETLCAIKQGETSFVLVNDQNLAKVIPTLDALQACQCDENAIAKDTPDNLEEIKHAAMQEFVNYKSRLTAQQTRSKVYTDALSAIHSWQGLGLPNAAQQALTSVNIAVRRGERRIAQKVNRLFDDIKAKANTITPYSLIDIENAINAIASSIPTQGRGSTNPTHFITICKN